MGMRESSASKVRCFNVFIVFTVWLVFLVMENSLATGQRHAAGNALFLLLFRVQTCPFRIQTYDSE